MSEHIATLTQLSGNAYSVSSQGQKYTLTLGDSLSINDVIVMGQGANAVLEVHGASQINLEPLQSLKLTQDLLPKTQSTYIESTLAADISASLMDQYGSELPLLDSALLTIEGEADGSLKSFKSSVTKSELKLLLADVLQQSLDSESLEQHLRFEQSTSETVIYLSNQGRFFTANDYAKLADKTLTIDTIGYSDTEHLLSYLVNSFLLDDQS